MLIFVLLQLNSVAQLMPDKVVTEVNWATISSTRYTKGTILVFTKTNDSLITFFKVTHIYLYDSVNLIFEGVLLRSLSYDDHYFAYEVEEPEVAEKVVQFHNLLVSLIPCNINVLMSGKNM